MMFMSIIPQKIPLGDREKLFRRIFEAPDDPCAVQAWKSHKEREGIFSEPAFYKSFVIHKLYL